MVQAYILAQTEVGASAEVAAALVELPGVASAHNVAGPYDVIALIEAANVSELGRTVIAQVQQIPGITRTITCTLVDL